MGCQDPRLLEQLGDVCLESRVRTQEGEGEEFVRIRRRMRYGVVAQDASCLRRRLEKDVDLGPVCSVVGDREGGGGVVGGNGGVEVVVGDDFGRGSGSGANKGCDLWAFGGVAGGGHVKLICVEGVHGG